MSYLSGNELKKEIRSAVPELGHRDLSVKYDGSYHVKVKKVVPLSKVSEIANKQESYERCEASGEILMGGNTFVFVEYCTWVMPKDEPYEVEVPEEMINAAVNAIATAGKLWDGADYSDRNKVLVNNIMKNEPVLFEEYNDNDVYSVVRLISNKSEEVSNWLNTGE